MNLQSLRTFQIAARHESFIVAAEELLYAQSTVTLHIKNLEAEWGVTLFERQKRGVRLTEAGRTVLPYVESCLGHIDTLHELVSGLATGEAGTIRLGCIEPTASLRLSMILSQFCQAHPQIRVNLDIGGAEALGKRVFNRELDFAISSPPSSPQLSFEPLFAEPMALLIPAGHFLAEQSSITLRDLSGARLLLTEPRCAYRRMIERVVKENGVSLHHSVQIGSIFALKKMVENQFGIAILPRISITPTPDGTVVRELEDIQIELPVGIVRRTDLTPPGAALTLLLDEIYQWRSAPQM